MGSEWEAAPLGLWKEIGGTNHHPPPQLPPGSHLLHHLWKWCQRMRQKQVVQHFGFTRNILERAGPASSCWVKDLPQLATWPTLASSAPSGFSHIWFKHVTTQFSANIHQGILAWSPEPGAWKPWF